MLKFNTILIYFDNKSSITFTAASIAIIFNCHTHPRQSYQNPLACTFSLLYIHLPVPDETILASLIGAFTAKITIRRPSAPVFVYTANTVDPFSIIPSRTYFSATLIYFKIIKIYLRVLFHYSTLPFLSMTPARCITFCIQDFMLI